MNASKLFAAVAAVAFAGSAFAVEVPVASVAVSAAAAAQAGFAAKNLNIPAVLVNKSGSPSRAEVRAEAIAAAQNQRSTFATQMDFLKN